MRLLLVPLDDSVLFPTMTATVAADVGGEKRVFVLPRKDGAYGGIAAFLRSIAEPGALADSAGYSPDLSVEDKRRLLETVDVARRLELAVELQRQRLPEL